MSKLQDVIVQEMKNLKVAPEKARRRVEPVVTEDKNVYRVEGFSCANCAGKFEKM